MANTSSLIITAINIRSAGSKDPASGDRLGGIYYPESTKNGKKISAHWEAICIVNHLGYTDEQGVYHEPSNLPLRVTAWNSRNAATGKGLADIFAKCVSVGKEFSASLRLRSYLKRHYVEGVPQVDHKGNPTMVQAYGWAIKSDLNWGVDSTATIAKEIVNYQNNPQSGFNRRPPGWNDSGTAANDAWKQIVKERMAIIYQGEPIFGYARVMIQEGSQVVNQAIPAGQTQQFVQQPVQQFVQQPGQQIITPAPITPAPVQQFVNVHGQLTDSLGQVLPQPAQALVQHPTIPAPVIGATPTTVIAPTPAANTMSPGAFSAGEAPI